MGSSTNVLDFILFLPLSSVTLKDIRRCVYYLFRLTSLECLQTLVIYGGDSRTRTYNLSVNSRSRYRLRHIPINFIFYFILCIYFTKKSVKSQVFNYWRRSEVSIPIRLITVPIVFKTSPRAASVTSAYVWHLALDFFDKGGTSGSQKPPFTHCPTTTLLDSGLKWYSMTDSNRQPSPCKGDTLPLS